MLNSQYLSMLDNFLVSDLFKNMDYLLKQLIKGKHIFCVTYFKNMDNIYHCLIIS